jgi:carboxyl-terminal processing protease
MSQRALISVALLGALLVLPRAALAEEKRAAEVRTDASALAQRLWNITDVVLQYHVKPPTRTEMLLAAVQPLAESPDHSVPTNLKTRVEAIQTADDLTSLVKELWPQEKKAGPAGKTEEAVHEALSKSVPGGAQFVAAEFLKGIEQVAKNRYVGTGIQVSYTNPEQEWVQIVTPIVRGPARRAGAKAGDVIVEIDGVSAKGMKLPELVRRLRGDEGTKVTMVVRRPDGSDTRTLPMTRSVVPFETAVGYTRITDDKWNFRVDAATPIAYVRVGSLVVSTLQELRQIERQLHADGIKAIVLDLRFCHGEELESAALVADGLLDGGLMWRVRDARNQVKEYRADRDCLFRDWPMAVLVGSQHGTLPSLVAAALQDNHRATIVGQPTQADNYVRTLVKLPNDEGAVTLSTGIVERAAAGKSDLTVQPDHVVPMDKKQLEAVWDWMHTQEKLDGPAEGQPKAADDLPLAKALDLLRGALKAKS